MKIYSLLQVLDKNYRDISRCLKLFELFQDFYLFIYLIHFFSRNS